LKSKFRKLAILLILAATPILRAADRSDRIRSLSQNFMCVCGCNQLLGACNHFHCPSSGPMMSELAKLVDQGKTDDEITAYFVNKYGSTVLAAPPASGFNLTAWITPFAALAIGALMAIYFLRQFRTRWTGAAEPNADLAKYQDKVEEELKKFIPED
jgi:cytochrome c-type biogenesis protein CcmH/NrfF